MKTLIILIALVLSTGLSAQQPKPSFEQDGDMVLATYFHDNGTVAQTGHFLNGKLHGVWKMFDNQGNKTAEGQYVNGLRAGKWLFFEDDGLKEVNFTDNTIASVIKHDESERVVIKN